MQLKILGNRGGMSNGNYTMSVLVDEIIGLDAGSGLHTLSVDQLFKIKDVILTHAHLDHIAMLCFWIDIHTINGSCVDIHASPETIATLRHSILNGNIWPNMEKILIDGKPAVVFHELTPYKKFTIHGRSFTPLPVIHGTPTYAYCLHGEKENFIFCVDMIDAPDLFWQYLHNLDNFHRMTMEISFPNSLEQLAIDSYHLTPNMINQLMIKDKIPNHINILYNHVKLQYIDIVDQETKALGYDRIQPLQLGDVINI